MPTAMPMTPPPLSPLPAPPRLKLVSFNIQVGLQTAHYRHYLTRAWRHALPGRHPQRMLDRIAAQIRDHDFVAIQEADAGSLRTGFIDQMAYLAQAAGFPQHGLTITRDLRPFARHALGYLSRWPVQVVAEHALPGPIRGRAALQLELQPPGGTPPWQLFVTHLSLGRGTQLRQLDYLAARCRHDRPVLIVGDLNAEPALLRAHPALRAAGLRVPDAPPPTFPSWAPRRCIDHVLLSPQIALHRLETLPGSGSDHLPLAAEISVPPQ